MLLLKSKSARALKLLLLLSCSYSSLNAGHDDKEKEIEGRIFPAYSPRNSQEIFYNDPAFIERLKAFCSPVSQQDIHINTLDEYFYDDIIKKWVEGTVLKIPEEVLAAAFDQPNIKEKIMIKMGYLQAASKFYPDKLKKEIPHIEQELDRYSLNSVANFNLGWLLSKSENPSAHYQTIFDKFSYAAKKIGERIPLAQYSLGTMYNNGYGVNRDPKMALDWIELAGSCGLPIAQYYLAKLYKALNKADMAEYWFDQAIVNGYHAAQYDLGSTLLHADNRQDQENGLYWLNKAAHNDLPEAQYDLAQLLANQGLYEVALPWMHQAVVNGHPLAAEALVEMQQKAQVISNFNEERKSGNYLGKTPSKWIAEVNRLYTELDEQKDNHLYFNDPEYYGGTEIDEHFSLKSMIALHRELAEFETKILGLLNFISSATPFSVLNQVQIMQSTLAPDYRFENEHYQLAHQFLNLLNSENWNENFEKTQQNFAKIKEYFTNPSHVFFLEEREKLNNYIHSLFIPTGLSKEEEAEYIRGLSIVELMRYRNKAALISSVKEGFYETQDKFKAIPIEEQNALMHSTIQDKTIELAQQEELLKKAIKVINDYLYEFEATKVIKEKK